ncbi:YkvA family protein [Leptolyngbyaceae cyanobacterium UHCC 1019]
MKNIFAVQAFSNWIFNWYRSTIRHPKWRWYLILGSLVYLLNPFDALPDFLPIAGMIDDGLIAAVLVSEVSQMMSDRLKSQKNKLSNSSIVNSETSVIDVESVSLS